MGYIGAGPTRFNTADELTVTGDAEFNGDLTVKGTHITLDSATVQTVDLGDNDKIRLGDSDDLQIYHDGSNSFIDDAGTGNVFLRGSSQVIIGNMTGEQAAVFNDSGAVTINYDNAQKLATTATGVDVTGVITTDGLTTSANINFGDNDRAIFGAGSDLQIYHDSNDSYINDTGTGNLRLAGSANVEIISSGGEFMAKFVADGASTLYHDNAAKLATTATGVDVTGTVTADGVESTCAAGDANQALLAYHPTSTSSRTIAKFQSNVGGTQQDKVVIKCNGNVGIGSASPTTGFRASINGDGSSIIGGVEFRNAAAGGETFTIGHATATSASGKLNVVGAANLVFATNNTEAARIDSAGGLRIGTTANIFNAASTMQFSVKNPGQGSPAEFQMTNQTGGFPVLYVATTDTTTTQTAILFKRASTLPGSITFTDSAVAYNTSSDYRLKTAVTYDWDATTRLKQLKPARFKWIADGADAVEVDGFLAHEAATVVPEAVSGTKDETRDVENAVLSSTGFVLHRGIAEADWTAGKLATTDDDGNTVDAIYPSDSTWAASHTEAVMQGIDQAKLVPLLVKTIQELEARITALETA